MWELISFLARDIKNQLLHVAGRYPLQPIILSRHEGKPHILLNLTLQEDTSMTEEADVGCERPAAGPVDEVQETEETKVQPIKKEVQPMIKVGQKAPDFSAPGYQQGKFINVKLSDHLGKWVLLCFYPGDFTFV